MIGKILAIAAGGAFGAVSRWLLASTIQRMAGGVFPWGTFAVNALGSFLLGFLFIWLIERSSIGELWRMAMTVGFLGAFTTFSTFSVESINLLEEGAYSLALGYILGQLILCLALAWSGAQLARLL